MLDKGRMVAHGIDVGTCRTEHALPTIFRNGCPTSAAPYDVHTEKHRSSDTFIQVPGTLKKIKDKNLLSVSDCMTNGCLFVKQINAATYGFRQYGICSVDKNGRRIESLRG
jgi:hypothetical protein